MPAANTAIDLGPYWRILPTSVTSPPGEQTILRVVPGQGFGDGAHETTQLCLLALGSLLRSGVVPSTVLDFGSGSGILSVAVAKFGARVEAVEIDPLAIEHGKQSACVNEVESLVDYRQAMSEPPEQYDLVVANILSQVLSDFAEALSRRVRPDGRMILSGLVATDLPMILARYRPLVEPRRAQVYARGDWRAVVFSPPH